MIGIFASDFNDFEGLLKKVCIIKKYNVKEIKIAEVSYNNKRFLLIGTGYGKVNIGFALGYILRSYQISNIIHIGNCASISTSKEFDDIFISSSAMHLDVDVSEFGYQKGVIPNINTRLFSSNEKLVKMAKDACDNLFIESHLGVIGSKEGFIASYDEKSNAKHIYKIDALDMESASYLQIGYVCDIPAVCIKGISNYADDYAVNEYSNNYIQSNIKACDVILKML